MHYLIAQNDTDMQKSNFIIVLGLLSMSLSLIANLTNLEELYPLFVLRNRDLRKHQKFIDYLRDIPFSMCISCMSDVFLMVYGIYIEDVIITIYGCLNSVLLIISVASIQIKINALNPNALLQTSGTKPVDLKPQTTLFG